MENCRLPNSQEKRNLIEYLQAKIKKCNDGLYASSGSQRMSQEEERWREKKRVYEEILEIIR